MTYLSHYPAKLFFKIIFLFYQQKQVVNPLFKKLPAANEFLFRKTAIQTLLIEFSKSII